MDGHEAALSNHTVPTIGFWTSKSKRWLWLAYFRWINAREEVSCHARSRAICPVHGAWTTYFLANEDNEGPWERHTQNRLRIEQSLWLFQYLSILSHHCIDPHGLIWIYRSTGPSEHFLSRTWPTEHMLHLKASDASGLLRSLVRKFQRICHGSNWHLLVTSCFVLLLFFFRGVRVSIWNRVAIFPNHPTVQVQDM
jgi:hypothetical protein